MSRYELFQKELKEELEGCEDTEPVITRITRDVEDAEHGKPLLLRCEATGTPKPRIEWEAPNGDVYRMRSDDFEGFYHFLV